MVKFSQIIIMINLKKTNQKTNQGISILGIIFWGFVAILVLSYFQINLKSVVESQESKENFEYVGTNTKSFWQKYLKDPAHYLWQDVWVDIFWKSFINNMERIRDGKPTDIDGASPKFESKGLH